ncbi:MAG: DinB family protein, partial [candidate division Zixibacteria bacterium]|nr:DinB family protein [candidate division Zixibacteria bacterium]
IQITPLPGYPPRIGRYLAQLEDVRRLTKRHVEGLSPEQLSWHPNPKVESIGTLLLHIAAVECSWIGEDIMRRPMGEEWHIAFPMRAEIPQITGKPLGHFFDVMDRVRAQTKADLATLADADLDRLLVPLDPGDSSGPERQFSIEWILYHVIEHEAHHKGQIAVMKRLLPV